MDLLVVSAARRVEARTTPEQLGFTPPPEDRDVLRAMEANARQLWSVVKFELVPFYEDATIEDKATIEEMLPIRARAERLATNLATDAAKLANGTQEEIQVLIERNASSFASSRRCSSGSRRERSSSRCCSDPSCRCL